MLERSKTNHDDESTVLGHSNRERCAERSAVETRRQFGKTAALGIAGIGLTGTQCVRHQPRIPPPPGACGDPIARNHNLVVKLVKHGEEMFYELPNGAGKVCKSNAGAEPIQMRLSEDSDVDSVFVKLRDAKQDLGSAFLRHPGNAGFEINKRQPITLVLKPTLGIRKRPAESRCTFCTEDGEFAKLILLSYHTSRDSNPLEHPHSQIDSDWHIEC